MTYGVDSVWTDDRIETVKQLWAEGLGASQIAARIGGVTRNAVIGKVHRLGLSGRRTAITKSTPSRGRRQGNGGGLAYKIANGTFGKPKPAKPIRATPRPREDIPLPESREISLVQLNHFTCKWPDGPVKDPALTYCGNATFGAKPYCEYHCGIAYQAPTRRLGGLERMARIV